MAIVRIIRRNYALIFVIGVFFLSILSINSNVTAIQNKTETKDATLENCYTGFSSAVAFVVFMSPKVVNLTNIFGDPELKALLIDTCEFYKQELGTYISPFPANDTMTKPLEAKLNSYLIQHGHSPEYLKEIIEKSIK